MIKILSYIKMRTKVQKTSINSVSVCVHFQCIFYTYRNIQNPQYTTNVSYVFSYLSCLLIELACANKN